MNTKIYLKQFKTGVTKEIIEFRRSLIWFPTVLVILLCSIMILGLVSMPEYQANRAIETLNKMHSTDNMFVASQIVMTLFYGISTIFISAALIVQANYSLSSLYDDRRDMSVYFWRSLPVSDALTIGIKLFVTLIVIPIMFIIAATVLCFSALVIFLILASTGFAEANFSIWAFIGNSDFIQHTLLLLWAVVPYGLWLLPLFAWFMCASAFAKRAPFLVAILPIGLIILIESVLLHMFGVGSMYFTQQISDYFSLYSQLHGSDVKFSIILGTNSNGLANPATLFANKIHIVGIIFSVVMLYVAWWLRKNKSH